MPDEALTGLCGSGQRTAQLVSIKTQICANLGFLGPNSEYACVNFFRTYFDLQHGNAAAH